MADTLLGVIIGGLIASIGQALALIDSRLRWNKEIGLQHLRSKREKLEKAFEGALDKIGEGMIENKYSSNMMSDFDYIFPKEVSEAFETLMSESDTSEGKKRQHYYSICRAMKSSLAKIDEEIESIIK